MPNTNRDVANSPDASISHDCQNETLKPETQTGSYSPEQLVQLADLVACGELDLPVELAPDQFERLVRHVRNRRRERLVDFIARAIAMDIHQSREL